MRERLDEVELTAALDEIWQRVKRLNRYVQDEEPWQLAKDEAQAERLDQVLYSLAEGLRVVSVLLHPFMPGSAERLLAALGREDLLARRRPRSGAVGGGATIGELGPALPARGAARAVGGLTRRAGATGAAVVDTHCHLDHCEPPDAELVERARAAGLTPDRHRRDGRPARSSAPSRRPRAHEEVFAIVGRHPHETAGFGAADLERDRARRGRPEGPRDRRDRPRLLPRLRARATTSGAPSRPSSSWPRGSGCRWRSTPARPRTTPSPCCASTPIGLPAVILHCFSAPDRLDECVERGYLCSFAGNVTYPKATDLQRAAREVPDELLLVETDSPYLSPQPRARQAERAGQRRAHRRSTWPSCAASSYEELERTVERNAARVFGW